MTSQVQRAANKCHEIRAEIERARLLPWSSAVGIDIGGFIVAPMSFRSLIDLELSKNAFIVGGDPLPGDVAAYLWRHHPDFSPSADSKKFISEVASSTNFIELVEGIQLHISAAFDETPASAHFGGTSSDNRLPPIPNIASICDEYGSAYGLDPQDVADIDLRIVFQCCRAQRMKQGAKYNENKRLRTAKRELLKEHGKN